MPKAECFHRTAQKYRKILAREGVKLKILPSDGSTGNLRRLADAKTGVDIGFVLGGAAGDKAFDQLMSLGSVSCPPLMIYYRGEKREAFKPPVDAARRGEPLRQLDHIGTAVNRIVIPASFGDLCYGLRGHINFVRQSLPAHPPPDQAGAQA